jgi:hypothetical protein
VSGTTPGKFTPIDQWTLPAWAICTLVLAAQPTTAKTHTPIQDKTLPMPTDAAGGAADPEERAAVGTVGKEASGKRDIMQTPANLSQRSGNGGVRANRMVANGHHFTAKHRHSMGWSLTKRCQT